jgi:hypothetical protein
MLLTRSGSLVVNLPGNCTFVNNGTLEIMDSPETVLPAGIVNNGTILSSSLPSANSPERRIASR